MFYDAFIHNELAQTQIVIRAQKYQFKA